MTTLPRDRRHGEELLSVTEPDITGEPPILSAPATKQIDRVILEYGQRQKLARFGYVPKAKLLFWGPPGCGKTLTAHWMAKELSLPVGTVRLSTLITSYLGETASHLHRVFETANETPMVLLLDEVDAIGKERSDRHDVGELKRVVNSLLQALDAIRTSKSIVIAATNHQSMLDEALWRRFDDIVEFPFPSSTQIKNYLATLLNGVTVEGMITNVVRAAVSLSFAQIEKTAIDVVKTMILENREVVQATDLSDAFKKYKTSLNAARKRGRSKLKSDE